jgi:soluble lytic murein transglycosylase-like protein
LVFQPHIERWRYLAERHADDGLIDGGLTADEILAVIANESNGDPTVTNKNDPSWGLMGVSLPIGKQYDEEVTTGSQLLDPDTNVKCGASYLSYLKEKYAARFPAYGWVAAYNEGETALLRGHVDTAYVTAFTKHMEGLSAY